MLFGTLVNIRRIAPAQAPTAAPESLKLAQPRPAIAAHRWVEAARRTVSPRG